VTPTVTTSAPPSETLAERLATAAARTADGLRAELAALSSLALSVAELARGARLAVERLGGRTPLAVTSYDPATLAMQSAIIANGYLYVCFRPGGHSRWTNVSTGAWLTDSDIPLDGVLVVDGATLGGDQ
jgi:hypothetical protein